MKRRTYLGALGFGVSTGVAGCIESLSDDSGSNNSDNYDQDSSNSERSSGRKKAHNIYFVDIHEVTPEQVSVQMTVTVNESADYKLQAHVVPLDGSYSGYWEAVNPPLAGYRNSSINYNPAEKEWYGRHQRARIEYFVDIDSIDKEPDFEFTIPSAGVENIDAMPGELPKALENYDAPVRDYGIPLVIDFEFSDGIPMYKPFVLAFSWEDDTIRDNRSGEIVSNTSPIVRTDEETIIHPFLTEDNMIIEPHATWDEHIDDSDDDAYRKMFGNHITEEDGVIKAKMVRVCDYGDFSDKYEELAQRGRDKGVRGEYGYNPQQLASVNSPHFFDGALMTPWVMEYELEREVVDQAHLDTIGGGDGVQRVHELINNDKVLNHPEIVNIAEKLDEICSQIGATEPSEKLEVVARFVQLFDHASEIPDEAGGTSHPLRTLARGYGDCKDFTVLTNVILQQEPFNYDTHIGAYEDTVSWMIPEEEALNPINHISTLVSMEDLGISDFVEDSVYGPGSEESEDGEYNASEGAPFQWRPEYITVDETDYLYVETSIYHPVGYQVHHSADPRLRPDTFDLKDYKEFWSID